MDAHDEMLAALRGDEPASAQSHTSDGLCAEQEQETVAQAMADVNVRIAVVTCRCGVKRALVKMYKCFYCEEWVCQWCAPHHFGMTKDEYQKKKAHNAKLTWPHDAAEQYL